MRIGVISDIHVDINYKENDEIETGLVTVIVNKKLDVLIIAGDISNDYQKTLETIDRLEEKTACVCLFVPGNHDLWNMHHKDMIHTIDIYDKLKSHKHCLCEKPYVLNDDYVVIGDVGWYDYSYGDERYVYDAYLTGHHNARQWEDKRHVHWHVSDKEKTTAYAEKLKEQLQDYSDKKIIFVTHMVTNPYFLVPLSNQDWDYFNAFLGSDIYEKILTDDVKYVVMGHVHYRKNLVENNRTYLCRCLNYRTQWLSHATLENIEDALEVIVI